ncbi:MAG: hypothetical protein R3E18_10255 [Sphingomonadaceae bacterium]
MVFHQPYEPDQRRRAAKDVDVPRDVLLQLAPFMLVIALGWRINVRPPCVPSSQAGWLH